MDDTELVIGSYENHILGYKPSLKFDGSYTLESSFTDDSHRGAIRCLSVSASGILASSSTDDSIRLHSLKKRKEVGGLFQHNGSVNSIRFFKGGHMLSASEDSTIGLWKCRTWELLRHLKGHKSHVKAVAVHPSGKLGFSVGSDRSLFTWDFTTGKVAFKTHIEKVAEDILFTRNGDHYILVFQKEIDICSVEDTKTVNEIHFGNRINSVELVKNDILAVGGDDRNVCIFNILSGKELLKVDCGKSGEKFAGRVRCLSAFYIQEETFLTMSTTSGNIKIFKLNLNEDSSSSQCILSYETGVRVTCMTTYLSCSNDKGLAEEKTKSDASQTEKEAKTKKKKRARKMEETSKFEDEPDKESNDIEENEPENISGLEEKSDGEGSDIEENEPEEILEEEDFNGSTDKQVMKTHVKDQKSLKSKGKGENKSKKAVDGEQFPKKKRKKM